MKIGVHDGTFHADDVLAIGVLSELNLVDDVVRTRDEAQLAQCDMRVDVGGRYDHSARDYDHHQIGGAGERSNGIPYAAFGLVWRHYGEQLIGDAAAAAVFDRDLVQPMDAEDVGVTGYELVNDTISLYSLGSAINRFNPQWNEPAEPQLFDEGFHQAVAFGRVVLRREMAHAKAVAEGEQKVREAIKASPDPRLVVMDRRYPWKHVVIHEAPAALYVVYQAEKENDWRLEAVTKKVGSFEMRSPLPMAWAGKRDDDLARITGVPDARFAHTARFLAATNTKTGALALAQIALAQANS